MQYDELSQRYQAAAKELLPVLSEVGGQTLQDEIKIELEDPAPLTGEFAPDHEYPLLKVILGTTTDCAYEHFFLMDKSLAGLISSWKVGGEAPEEIGDEHLDAVKEVGAQILGQLQAAFEGKEYAFTAGDVQLAEVPSQEELGLPEEGLAATCRFTRGKKKKQKHLITHVVKGEPVPEEIEGTAAEEEAVEEEAAAQEAAVGEEAADLAVDEGTTEEVAEGVEAADLAVDEGTTEEVAEGVEVADLTADEDITKEEVEGVSGDLPQEEEADVGGAAGIAALFGEEGDEGGVVEVSPAEFDEFVETRPSVAKGRKIDLLLDVELDVAVELGRKVMYVEEILRLGKGSVVELDKLAGEPVDVLVNGKKLAEGEVVVVEDHFGVRLTHLIEPKERIKSLGKQ